MRCSHTPRRSVGRTSRGGGTRPSSQRYSYRFMHRAASLNPVVPSDNFSIFLLGTGSQRMCQQLDRRSAEVVALTYLGICVLLTDWPGLAPKVEEPACSV